MSINLETKVETFKGVGPKFSAKLNKLGVETVQDLLYYYPRRYLDFTQPMAISSIGSKDIGNFVVLKGKIATINNKKTSKRRFTITEAYLEDETGSIKLIWFNQPFLLKMLTVGRELIVYGKLSHNSYSNELAIESPERSLFPKIEAIYPETEGISSRYISRLIDGCKMQVTSLEEWIPKNILEKQQLISLQDAILSIHFPKSNKILDEARRRLAFDELFTIALKSQVSKEEAKKSNAPALNYLAEKVDSFIDSLPFELTGDQKKSVEAVLSDIKGKQPMNRLLNGDVGSGKTVVAAVAAYAAVLAGFRAVIMAPTSILANQHYETFISLFKKQDISIGLFTRERKERNNIEKSSDKEILDAGIIVGTQALIQKDVVIEDIGLVVVDEQHRFGVKQRQALLFERGNQRPHFLSMTATPIPRTLHLALFGDLDLSVIKEKPANRKEIKTRLALPQNRAKAYDFIKQNIEHGRQTFVICPLIEEKSDNASAEIEFDERKTVVAEYEKLQKIFPQFKIGMLHGKMKAKEKDEIMGRFSSTEIDILVSTSVVEVGVDVPNANIMVIEDAEHFGLAQLHQFRGRVGRGEHQSFCLLFSSTGSDKALRRLRALERTNDGFELAETDLEERGPGAIFGTEQSGMLDLQMASLSDRMLIMQASDAAKELVQSDPELLRHPKLKEKIIDFLQTKHLE